MSELEGFANPKAGEWLGAAFDGMIRNGRPAITPDQVREAINDELPGLENRFDVESDRFGGGWRMRSRLVLGQEMVISDAQLDYHPDRYYFGNPAAVHGGVLEFIRRFRWDALKRFGLEKEMVQREHESYVKGYNEALRDLIERMKEETKFRESPGFLEAFAVLGIRADQIRKRVL